MSRVFWIAIVVVVVFGIAAAMAIAESARTREWLKQGWTILSAGAAIVLAGRVVQGVPLTDVERLILVVILIAFVIGSVFKVRAEN